MSDATTGGKVAEGEYEVKDAWDGPEAGRWVRLWREAIIPNLYRIQRGQVVWSPPLHENAIQVIGPIRSAGSRVKVRMPQGEVPAATLVSIYLVNAKRNPDYRAAPSASGGRSARSWAILPSARSCQPTWISKWSLNLVLRSRV